MNPVPPFSEDDLDKLEALLNSEIFRDEAMQLDELQALICAVVSGPELIPPHIWLPAALGEHPAYASADQASEVLNLVMSFYNDIAATLLANDGWELILYPFEDDPEELDFASWADAYIFGSQLGQDWYEAAGEDGEELTSLLQPFFLLNGMLKADTEDHRERWMSPTEEKLAVSRAEEELPELVTEIYNFWRDKRSGEKIRRPTASDLIPQDACPCGSGKTFKQCCGSPGRLH